MRSVSKRVCTKRTQTNRCVKEKSMLVCEKGVKEDGSGMQQACNWCLVSDEQCVCWRYVYEAILFKLLRGSLVSGRHLHR
jgi:hypothetical protein